jgi:hypothetical protein
MLHREGYLSLLQLTLDEQVPSEWVREGDVRRHHEKKVAQKIV